MTSAAALAGLEDIIGRARVAARIEALLPIGVRHRQLPVRTLLLGMLLVLADHRPAHLTRVHDALTSLPGTDQARLGVIAGWKTRPAPAHLPPDRAHLRPRRQGTGKRHPRRRPLPAADPHLRRPARSQHPRRAQEHHPGAGRGLERPGNLLPPAISGQPGLRRPRSVLGTPQGRRPRPAQRAVLRVLPLRRHDGAGRTRAARPRAGPPDDPDLLPPGPGPGPGPGPAARMPRTASRSATCSPTPATLTAPPTAGPSRCAPPAPALIQDLHPDDRGPQGTHHGAIISNGTLYCPATPRPLLELGPLARDATPDQTTAHDQQTAETARYKLGKITSRRH